MFILNMCQLALESAPARHRFALAHPSFPLSSFSLRVRIISFGPSPLLFRQFKFLAVFVTQYAGLFLAKKETIFSILC